MDLKRNTMCVMCYIGVTSEIEEIKFDENNPSFSIEKVHSSDFDEDTFSTKSIYFIGSGAECGCSCNFGISSIPENIISDVRAALKEQRKIPKEYRGHFPDISIFFSRKRTIEQVEKTINFKKKYAERTDRLYALIYSLCEENDSVEFFGCWTGCEKYKPEETTQINLSTDKLEIDFGDYCYKVIIKR